MLALVLRRVCQSFVFWGFVAWFIRFLLFFYCFFRFSLNKVSCALVDLYVFVHFFSCFFRFVFLALLASILVIYLSLSTCVLAPFGVLCVLLRHSSGHVHTAKISSCKHRMSSWRKRRSSCSMQASTALERWV